MFRLTPEMLWRSDPNIDAARRLPAWPAFHKACSAAGFHFDHIEKQGRGYAAVAFTAVKRRGLFEFVQLATGTGKTVLAALVDAHAKSGRATPATTAVLAALTAPVVAASDFDDLLVDEFEELL